MALQDQCELKAPRMAILLHTTNTRQILPVRLDDSLAGFLTSPPPSWRMRCFAECYLHCGWRRQMNAAVLCLQKEGFNRGMGSLTLPLYPGGRYHMAI